jgi:hypothetical protein
VLPGDAGRAAPAPTGIPHPEQYRAAGGTSALQARQRERASEAPHALQKFPAGVGALQDGQYGPVGEVTGGKSSADAGELVTGQQVDDSRTAQLGAENDPARMVRR